VTFRLPFPTSTISSPFGMRVNPITGVKKLHTGTDFAVKAGTPIPAIAAGTVVGKGSNLNKTSGYGHWVRVRAENGLYYLAAHMQAASPLAVGQAVKLGTVLGNVGSTGASTGPHLHLGLSTGVEAGFIDLVSYVRSQVAPPAAPAPIAGTYTVQRGDTLSAIAARHGTTWQALYALNRATIGANPNRIFAGQVLRIAGAAPAAPAPAPKPVARTYTVKRGDTLSGIATRLGVRGGWRALYNANRSVVGSNPNRIFAGQVLTLP
jgi:murein DD-endopeptidase MepM/ murein hydrolase activator NlpD